jgi:hypothetical protein
MESLALPDSVAWRMYTCFKGCSLRRFSCVYSTAYRPSCRSAYQMEGQVCRQNSRYCGSFASLDMLERIERCARRVRDRICAQVFSICTQGFSQKACLFVWSVSNTQGIVRRVCKVLSVGSLPICGAPSPRAPHQKGMRGAE